LPSLENLHRHFEGQPFVILAIDVGEEKEKVEEFVKERGLSFRFLLDKNTYVSKSYGIRSHPMKFLIDERGDLIGIAYGYREWDTEEMKTLIKRLLDTA
jgi:peroxiredoxin